MTFTGSTRSTVERLAPQAKASECLFFHRPLRGEGGGLGARVGFLW